ncbi:MAG TPA: DPP IV N-terminal domain-containing protein [Spirochaetota bacterium]|nr:DPP IV N-terminal domain-containing protein [Spirochaetota bacterium]
MIKILQLIFLSILILNIPACYTRDYDEDLLIYFVRTGNIYQITEDGENLKLLLGGATYNYPCVSPDGKYLVCKSPTNSIIYNISDMSVYSTLTTTNALNHSWSPDGTKVAATIDAGFVRVYDVRTGLPVWTRSGGGMHGHYFTNDSNYIAETIATTLNEFIHTSGADVVADRTRTLPGTFYDLTLSPDGAYLTGHDSANIYLITNIDTPSSQLLVTGIQPSWSPDGKSIVYNNGGNLYIYQLDDGSSRQLTFSGTDSYPCYQYKPR